MAQLSTRTSPNELHYDSGQKGGVTVVALSGLSSLLAILYLLIIIRPSPRSFRGTHIFGYFMCLLASNVLQAVGSVMDFQWVARGGVVEDVSCGFQGGIKQAGNLGASTWSLVLAFHVYFLVFFRIRSNKATFMGAISFFWSLILTLILLGRFVLQEAEHGPYFGISEASCWITAAYNGGQMFSKYLLNFLSIGVSFLLYGAVFLRVRGNLVKRDGNKWCFQFVGKENGSFSVFSRDINIATSTLRTVKSMLLYPVYYTIMILPTTIIRIYEFKGHSAPFPLTTVAVVIFNLIGVINVFFIIYLTRRLPGSTILPSFPVKLGHAMNSGSISKSLDIAGSPLFEESGQNKMHMDDVPDIVTVEFPTQPSGTYIAPVSWKTTAPAGRKY